MERLLDHSKLICLQLYIYMYIYIHRLTWWLSGKESACNIGASGDSGSIPELGGSPGGGHGNSLQYSNLENPMD